jgi:hypothetical protein
MLFRQMQMSVPEVQAFAPCTGVHASPVAGVPTQAGRMPAPAPPLPIIPGAPAPPPRLPPPPMFARPPPPIASGAPPASFGAPLKPGEPAEGKPGEPAEGKPGEPAEGNVVLAPALCAPACELVAPALGSPVSPPTLSPPPSAELPPHAATVAIPINKMPNLSLVSFIGSPRSGVKRKLFCELSRFFREKITVFGYGVPHGSVTRQKSRVSVTFCIQAWIFAKSIQL